jgi:HAD superfamily hydrolase (TIGR01509 family)
MNSPCRAILFDLVGVLLFCRADHVPNPTVDAIDSIIGQVRDDQRFREEAITTYSLSGTEFEHVLVNIVEKYAPFQPLWELLPELRDHYKLGIINNGTYLTYPLFNFRLGIEDLFDLFLSSGREGICKPDMRIFELACQRLGIPPEQCLFMDDSEANIESARQIGMQAILWQEAFLGFRLFQDWLKVEKSSGIAMTFPGLFLL